MGNKLEKIVEKMINSPQKIPFNDVDYLLKFFGFEARNSGSSHFIYRKKGTMPFTIPYKKPHIKEVYIKNLVKKLVLREWLDKK